MTDDGAVTVDSTPIADNVSAPSPANSTIQVQLAVLTAVAGGVLAAGSYLGWLGLLVAVALAQAALTGSWVFGTGLPGRIGAVVLSVLAAGGADAAVSHWSQSGYSPVLGVLGVAIPLMFIHQLTRGVVRTRVVESLADTTVLLIAVVALAGLIVLRQQSNGATVTPALLGALAAGLVAGHIVDAVLPKPRFDPTIDRGLPAVLVGVIVGGVIGLLALRHIIDYAGGRGAFVGAAVAAVACLLSIGAAFSASHSSLDRPIPLTSLDGETELAADAAGPVDVAPVSANFRISRLQPVAAVLMTIALTTPAAYVLTNALAG